MSEYTIFGFTWQGTWSSVTAYNPYDVVQRDGSMYNCVAQNTNVDPTTDGGSNWQLAASIGNTGATGATGPAGPAPSGTGNFVLATPNGSSGVSGLRALVLADLPTIPFSDISGSVASSQLPAAVGTSTSATPSNVPNGYVTALTLSAVNFSGNYPVMLTTVLNSDNSYGFKCTLQFFRDGSAIGPVFHSSSTSASYGGDVGQGIGVFVDTPSAGSHTYSVQWASPGAGGAGWTLYTSTMSAYEIH